MSNQRDRMMREALEAKEAMTRHSKVLEIAGLTARSPRLEAARSIQENAALQQMLKAIGRDQAMIRMAAGPLGELRRAGVFEHGSLLAPELEQTRCAMAVFSLANGSGFQGLPNRCA